MNPFHQKSCYFPNKNFYLPQHPPPPPPLRNCSNNNRTFDQKIIRPNQHQQTNFPNNNSFLINPINIEEIISLKRNPSEFLPKNIHTQQIYENRFEEKASVKQIPQELSYQKIQNRQGEEKNFMKENSSEILQQKSQNKNRNEKNAIDKEIKKKPEICEICEISKKKYCCPGCKAFTCSLKCIKEHKKNGRCNGIFKVNKFITKTGFDQKQGIKDYNYLNNMITNIEKTKKHLSLLKRKGNSSEALRYKLLRVFSKKNNDVELVILPFIFSRHRENLSFYYTKKRTIFWTCEFFIYQKHKTFKRILNQKPINEEIQMKDILGNIEVESENQKALCEDLKNMKGNIFFKGDPKKDFTEISLESTIKSNIKGGKIVEFPSFYIVDLEDVENFKKEFVIKT